MTIICITVVAIGSCSGRGSGVISAAILDYRKEEKDAGT